MSVCVFQGGRVIAGMATAKSYPGNPHYVINRLPTDPLFYSDVVLENIIAGSRYRITADATVLALDMVGLAYEPSIYNVSSTDTTVDTTAITVDHNVAGLNVTETVTGLAVYTNPQLLKCEVRYSSSSIKYSPLTIYAYQDREGASFYVSQVVDTVAL